MDNVSSSLPGDKVSNIIDRMEIRGAAGNAKLEAGQKADAERLRTVIEDVTAVYWVLLGYLESSLRDGDGIKKNDIEAAYKVWNRVHGTELVPQHIKRNPSGSH